MKFVSNNTTDTDKTFVKSNKKYMTIDIFFQFKIGNFSNNVSLMNHISMEDHVEKPEEMSSKICNPGQNISDKL